MYFLKLFILHSQNSYYPSVFEYMLDILIKKATLNFLEKDIDYFYA